MPPTLGETQMKYLQGLTSMRRYPLQDFRNPISPTSTLRSEVDSLLGEDYIQSSLQSSDEHSVGSTKEKIVKTSVGEGPISVVKKYLENNICELREHLTPEEQEWQRQGQKSQGTHMTPRLTRDQSSGRTPPLTREQGINMDTPPGQGTIPVTQQQAGNERYCLNCQQYGHNAYGCPQPGHEQAVSFL